MLRRKKFSTMPEDRGNILTVELLQRRWLTDDVFEIELKRPPDLQFKAGQTLRFIHESMERYYSLLSAPDDPTLKLCIYHVRRGKFSPMLAEAGIGSAFNATGPHGYFLFNPSDRKPVFVATGTGIAPFASMARSGVTDFILLHEVESSRNLYYSELFQKVATDYVPCLLNPSAPDPSPPGAFHGPASGYLKQYLPPAGYDFYLCGGRDMTRAVTLQADERFPGSYVFKEVFY